VPLLDRSRRLSLMVERTMPAAVKQCRAERRIERRKVTIDDAILAVTPAAFTACRPPDAILRH
jgi:hypothetical protein